MNDLQFEQVANIKVLGIDGGDRNAVNRVVSESVEGVEFCVANTDLRTLDTSPVGNRIVLGREVIKGLGAGANLETGRCTVQENENETRETIRGSDMVSVTTGLGGRIGTGAAPMFVKIAKKEGTSMVGIVIKPLTFEEKKRIESVEDGFAELEQYADSLIIIPNGNLIEVVGRHLLTEAFQATDNVLRWGIQTITGLTAAPALINLDFADVRTVMENQGSALIGVGMTEGGDKARAAAERAVQSSLLEAQITGASNATVSITSRESVTLFDVEDVMALVREAVGSDIDAIFGIVINEKLGDPIVVTITATGFDREEEGEEEIPVTSALTQPASRPSVRVQTEEKPRYQELEGDNRGGIPFFFSRRQSL